MTTSMKSRALLVTDASSRDEVAEAIAHVNTMAKLSRPDVGSTGHPTVWDRRHELLNAMLTDWQTRPV